jgi:hypothetical protein
MVYTHDGSNSRHTARASWCDVWVWLYGGGCGAQGREVEELEERVAVAKSMHVGAVRVQ